MTKPTHCPCGSGKIFSRCCLPFIEGRAVPDKPELLMRSRYSAYATNHYQYIADTYATNEQSNALTGGVEQSRVNASAAQIEESSKNTNWCKLEVLSSHYNGNSGDVEFIAYYQHSGQFYAMHERSRFVKNSNKWLYVDGQMLDNSGSVKIGRNDSCLCGSGKKFKRCCQH